jgi:hypothetical protein
MALERDPKNPSVWIDAGLPAGPSTLAVVIGVSEYRHLDGGPAQYPKAQTTFGLPQLSVSALTAYRLFEWLRAQYRFAPAPLSHCWVLLSPSQAEKNIAKGLHGWPAATFEACKTALEGWANAIASLDTASQKKSRALFIFSGHGFAKNGLQFLLPTDYLAPPGDINAAISTGNLLRGLKRYAIDADIFLIDACREPPPDLKPAWRGSRILRESRDLPPDSHRASAVVYACGDGAAAFQPKSPADGLSLFGDAVLDGLRRAKEGDCDDDPPHVTLDQLVARVNRTMKVRLREIGEPVERPIWYGEKLAPSLCLIDSAGRAQVRGGRLRDDDPVRTRRESSRRLPDIPAIPERERELHEILGHESSTGPWVHTRVWKLGNHAQLGDTHPVIRSIDQLEGGSVQVTFSLERPGSFWMEWPLGQGAFASCLVGDQGTVWYTAEFGDGYMGTGLTLALSTDNVGYLGEAAVAWEHFSLGQFDFVRGWVRDVSKIVIASNSPSPLAGMIAAMLALRLGETRSLVDQLEALRQGFPNLPEIAALLGLAVRRAPDLDATRIADIVRNLQLLQLDGLPGLAPVFEDVSELTDEVVEAILPGSVLANIPEVRQLNELAGDLSGVATYNRMSRFEGLFNVYLVPDDAELDRVRSFFL